MSLVKRLLDQLERRGLSITPGAEPGALLLHGPESERTPEILAALKAFKPELLAMYQPAASRLPVEPVQILQTRVAVPVPRSTSDRLPVPSVGGAVAPAPAPETETCAVCARVVDAEDRDVIATNHVLCDRGGSRKTVRDADGRVHEASPRCPYKPPV